MRLRVFLLMVCLLVVLPMKADTTYTYVGNSFDPLQSAAPFSASNSISGYFTTSSPIAANTGNFGTNFLGSPTVTGATILNVTSYSFTDGVDKITSSDADLGSPIITIATDGSGNVIAWGLDISRMSGEDMFWSWRDPVGFGFNGNDGALDINGNYGGNSNNPGMWTITNGLTPTPEPGSLVLLGTGLFGAAALLRRRMHKA